MGYRSEVLADGPLAFWPLAGGALGDVVGSQHLTVYAGSAPSSVAGPGGWDVAADVAAGNLTSSQRLPQSAYTLEAWAYIDAAPSGDDVGVIADWGGDAALGAMITIKDGTTQPRGLHKAVDLLGPTLALDTWYHLALTWDGADVTLYVNGVDVATAPSTGAPGTSTGSGNGMYVSGYGKAPGSGRRLDGYVWGAAMYDTALTADRLVAHADAGLRPTGYWDAVAQDGADVYLAFDETSDASTALDRSGSGRHATEYGSSGTSTLGNPALTGIGSDDLPASWERGAGDYYWATNANANDTGLDVGTGEFAYEFWVVCSNSTGNYVQVMGRDSSATGNGQLIYLNTGDGKLRFYLGGNTLQSTGQQISDGVLHHVICQRRAGNAEIYVDGKLEASVAAGGGTDVANRPFRIGLADGSLDEYVGFMAGVAYYKAALSPARISAHYLLGLDELTLLHEQVLRLDPDGYWPLDETSGDVHDRSGWNRDGATDGTVTRPASNTLPAGGGLTVATAGRVLIPDDAAWDDGTPGWCAGIWFRTAASIPGADQAMFTRQDSGPTQSWGLYRNAGDGGLECFITPDGSSYSVLTYGTDVGDGEWHLLVMTADGSNTRLFLDCEEIDSESFSGTTRSTSAGLTIGALGGSLASGFDGDLAHAFTGDFAPTVVDIARMYVAGLQLLYADVVADDTPAGYWPMTETSGTTFVDDAGANDLAITSGAAALADMELVAGTRSPRGDFTASVAAAATAPGDGTFTFEAWVRIIADVGNSLPLYIGNSASNGAGILLSAPSSGSPGRRFQSLHGGGGGGIINGADVSYLDRHHLVVTRDGTTDRLFLDGVLINSGTAGINGGAAATTVDSTSTTMAVGHAAAYDARLTAGRIAIHYAAGLVYATPTPAGLVDYLAVDFTGNGDLDVTIPDSANLVADFTGDGDLATVITQLQFLGVVAFTGRGDLAATFRNRSMRRRTVITTSEGDVLAILPEAGHGPISFELNREEEASIALPIDIPQGAAILEEDFREAQLWFGDQLLVFGPLVRPSADPNTLSAVVKGPSWHLTRRHVGKARRTEYVPNGDFEDGLAGWGLGINPVQAFYGGPGYQSVPPGAEIVRFPTVTGYRALRSENYVENTANVIFQSFLWEVDPSTNPAGDRWTLSGYYRVESFDADSAVNGIIAIRYSTTQPSEDPYTLAAVPDAKRENGHALFKIDPEDPRDVWLPFSVDFDQPVIGEPEVISVQIGPPVGVVYWDRIRLTRVESTRWDGVDQDEIIGDLVAHAQDPAFDKDDVNLTHRPRPTGVLRDLELIHHEHPNIWSEITKITELEDGVDVDVLQTPTQRIVRTHFPMRGRYHPELELRLGSNVAGFSWAFDGESASSSIIVLGTGDGSAREEVAAIDPDAFAGGLTLEEVFSAPADTRIEKLDKIAGERLAIGISPEVLAVRTMPHSLTIRPRNFVGRLQPGDTLPVHIVRGVLSIIGTYRVSRLTLNPDNTLDLVLGRRSLT